jgi:hypothetical protein
MLEIFINFINIFLLCDVAFVIRKVFNVNLITFSDAIIIII